MSTRTPLPDWCHGLIDDAAIFPPGNADLDGAMAAHLTRRQQPHAELVGPLVVRDTDLPQLGDFPAPVALIVTGGAGQIAGPLGLARKQGIEVAQIEIALRDPDDLAGNARRVALAVDAARMDGALDFEVPVYVELPDTGYFGRWGDPIEVLVEQDFRLKLRTGGLEAASVPSAQKLADWLDLVQAYAIPFKCTAGLHRALPHDGQHGFINVLLATRMAFDGTGIKEVVALLDDPSPEIPDTDELVRARRWFTSFGSCSIDEPLADLRELGLVA